MDALKFSTGSGLSVRLHTADAKGPIIVILERTALDARFRFPSSLAKFRVELVMANLEVLEGLVREKVARKEWTRGVGAKSRQVVVGRKDLEGLPLREPTWTSS
jgi:hypothetical protein